MTVPWKNRRGAAKVAALCAAVLLVSAGLCGMQLLWLNRAGGMSENLGVFMITGAIELMAMLASVVVGFIALLVWGFGSMFRRDPED